MVGRPQIMRGYTKLFSVLVIGAFMALPAGAFAQSADTGYNVPGGVVQDQIETQPAQAEDETNSTPPAVTAAAPPAQAQADTGGDLPFTGFDLALVVGAGGVLLLLGFGIRRFTQASEAV
jgi:hypothetical protein